MSRHDDPKNGGRRMPPPPQVAHQIRNPTAAFRAIVQPGMPERRPPGQKNEHKPPGAGATASIAMRVPKAVAALNPPSSMANSGPIDASAVKGHTIAPPPLKKDPEEERKIAEEAAQKAVKNEAQFLRFGNAMQRASEIMRESWVEWVADPELLREKVVKAVEYLKEKRNENENYASDYQMLRAFSGMIAKEEKLNDYLAWVETKEKGFVEMAHVYTNLSMGPLTPYAELLDACREANLASDEGFLGFLAMVGDEDCYEGTDYARGELYRKMFDAWYVRKAGEAMRNEYQLSALVEERDRALRHAGELTSQVVVLSEENKNLRRSAGSNVPPQIMEEVHRLRQGLSGLGAENETLKRENAALADANGYLLERNGQLDGAVANLKQEKASLEKELAEEKETSSVFMERIRLLVEKTDAYEAKMEGLEGRLAAMESHMERVEAERARLSRELALEKDPEVGERETMVSGFFPAVSTGEEAELKPPAAAPEVSSMIALKELTEEIARRRSGEREEEPLGLEEELGDMLAGALPPAAEPEERVIVEESGQGRVRSGEAATEVSMVPAVEATLSEKRAPVLEDIGSLAPFATPVPPVEEDDTGQIDIEREGMLLAEEEPASGIWATKPGKAVKAIFAYGFAGKGAVPTRPLKMKVEFPPLGETGDRYDEAVEAQKKEDERYERAWEEYSAWYNKAGRWVHARRESVVSAADSVAEFYSRKRRQVQMAAAGVIVAGTVAAIAVGGYMTFGASQRAEEAGMLQKPAAVQVDAPEVEGRGMHGVQAPQEVQEEAPEPLARPGLSDVLAKHGLGELDDKTHIVKFYRGMDGVSDVQERYVVLAEALGADARLQRYERSYHEAIVLGMYQDFLSTAMGYAQLENQDVSEKAEARVLGEQVAKRMLARIQHKRTVKSLGGERIAELGRAAAEFNDFAENLPVVVEDEPKLEVPVVTAEQLQEMKRAGEKPASGVIILPDSSAGKPFDMQKAIDEAIGEEFRVLGTPSKVNDFNRELGRVDDDVKAFLMRAHLSSQLVESGLGESMSNRRVIFMHIDTMNAAVKFAMAEGQGMAAIAEAMNIFDIADGEVKGILAQKRNQGILGQSKESVEKNITWLRNRAEELRNRADAYEKAAPVPLPGSPSLENGNGAPTAIPEKITLDRHNTEAALQMVVFSEHGLSILEHPLKVYKQMRGMKINNFDRAIILENLADRIMTGSRWMDGLSKTEQFEMLRIMAAYLRTAVRAANEPKNWREDYDDTRIMVGSSALHVSEAIKEIRKLDKADLTGVQAHLRFSIDKATFDELGEAVREFDEQLVYRQRQKLRRVEE